MKRTNSKKYLFIFILFLGCSNLSTNSSHKIAKKIVEEYKQDVIPILKKMVSFPTFNNDPNIPSYENKAIIAFGEYIRSLALEYNLEFENIDNRIFEVRLPGISDEYIGIYTHGDVVPVNPNDWILPSGHKLDPFTLEIIDQKLYGRGTEDDKASISAAITIMRALKAKNIVLKRGIKLIIETTEETTSAGIEYYKDVKKKKLPTHNLVLDASYPVVIAEKGFGQIEFLFNKKRISNLLKKDIKIIDMTGAMAINQIPLKSKILLETPNIDYWMTKLSDILESKPRDYTWKISHERNIINLEIIGVSAHSSAPQAGVNPIPRAFSFIHNELSTQKGFIANEYTDAAQIIFDNFGIGYLGKKLGIDYSDDFMGPLTVSVTMINKINNELKVGISFRQPKPKTPSELKNLIEEKLENYKKNHTITFNVDINVKSDFLYRDIKGAWIDRLLSIFNQVTGKSLKPISISGGTTAKYLPNGISFGPSMPGEKYMGHNNNEFKKIDNLYLDLELFAYAFIELGNIEEL